MIDSSVLGQYSLFDGLEQTQIDGILPLMKHEVYEAGEDIISEGGHNDKLYFILEGRVAVVKSGIILSEFSEGVVFGEMEVLELAPVEATIKTLTSAKIMSLSIDALGEIYETDLKTYAFIIMNLARDLSRRLRHMNEKVARDTPYMEWN